MKEMLNNGWFARVVLVLWLVSAVFVVSLLSRVDWIVHHELYNYGLRFSPEWASGYWVALRMIYVFLAAPIILSVAYFGLEIWRFVKGRGHVIKTETPRSAKPISIRQKAVVEEQNHMLICCPKCKRVFSRPLVMLDFSCGKTGLVNVCPYCNHVLGCVEEGAVENKKADNVGLMDLERSKVEKR